MQTVSFIDDKYNVYNGAQIVYNCQGTDHVQFSYNSAVFTLGAATMFAFVSVSNISTENWLLHAYIL